MVAQRVATPLPTGATDFDPTNRNYNFFDELDDELARLEDPGTTATAL